MKLFYQDRSKIYDAENLSVVKHDYPEDHKEGERLIRNGRWISGYDGDEFTFDFAGTYGSNERAFEVLEECVTTLERGDAVYRMPKE